MLNIKKYYLSLNKLKLKPINYMNYKSSLSNNNDNIKPFNLLPGPKTYPFIGNLLELKQFGGTLNMSELYCFIDKLYNKYGDIVKWSLLNRTQVFIYNPEHVKKIHQIDGLTPERKVVRPWMFYYKKRSLPIPIFNSVGQRWKRLRSVGNFIAKPQTIFTYINRHCQVIDDFIHINIEQQLKKNNNNYAIINSFERKLNLFSLEMISVVALENRIECIDDSRRSDEITKFVSSLETFMMLTIKLSISLPIWKYYPTKDRRDFFEAFDFLYKTASKYINDASNRLLLLNNSENNDNNNNNNNTILQQLLLNKQKLNLTLDDINAIMVDLIMAGVDTTATSLHYILYEIGKNNYIQDALYNEIIKNIQDENNIDQDNLAKMHYLKAILKETLRLHTVLPIYPRILQQDLILNNFLLPKGTNVSICMMHMSRSSKYFSQPLTFNPSRWLDGNENINYYASLPFGYGVRMCLGRRLAEQEIYLLLIKLIKNYKIEYVGDNITRYKFGLLAFPNRPLNLKFEKRPLFNNK